VKETSPWLRYSGDRGIRDLDRPGRDRAKLRVDSKSLAASLAASFRGKFEEVPGSEETLVKPGAAGKAHPQLWAAFTLSGPGR
jgi:hypothetical protein